MLTLKNRERSAGRRVMLGGMIVAPTIRLATAHDAHAIAEMSRDEIERGLGWSWTPSRVLRAIREPSTNVAVALAGGRIAGFGIMKYGETKAHLTLLAVQPGRREQGVGRQLLEWLEKCARTAGLERIEVEARADNALGLAFYALQGYERIGVVHGYYEGRIDAVRMAKSLTAALLG
jgi:ribosomal protein S18 acetylase RimI-like enzyme